MTFNMQNYSSAHFNLYVFGQQMERKNILDIIVSVVS